MISVTRNLKYATAIRYFLFATVSMLLLPLFAYGDMKNGGQSDVSGTPVQQEQLKTIIVDNYYPYTFVNENGDPDGFSVDLIKAVAQEMGLEVIIHVDTWELARKALKDGNIDVLPMMAYSKERDRQFDFSVPHTVAYDAFFTRKDAGRIRSLDDLRGKKIIVMKGDQAHDYLLSTGLIGPEQLIFIDSLPDALRLLSSGKGDAALMPKLVGLIVAKNLKLGNLELSPIVIEAYNRPFSFAVAEGNLPLLERLSQGLSIIKDSGQYSNIYKKWFGALEPPGFSLRTVLKYIGGIILVFILIGSVLLLWSFSLKKQVALRTKSLGEEIAERKQAEALLRESEERYRLLIENQTDMVVKFNTEGKLLFVSPSYCKTFGKTIDELLGKKFMPLIHEGDRESVKRAIGKVYQPPYTGYVEERAKTKDGWRWQSWLNTAVLNEAGEVEAIVAVGRDISEQKRTEQKLLKSEKGFRDLFDSITDLIYTQDLDGRFISVNPAMSTLFGYEKDELIGRPASDFMMPKMRPFFKSGYLEQIKAKGSHEGVTTYFAKNGDEIYIDYRSSLIDPDDGEPYISGTGRDVTEHVLSQREIKRLQNQILQSQKMEAIGLMAGGVAHDLNNILSGIVSYPELLLMDLPEESPLRKPIKMIQESGMRAADVVADLLTVARGVATAKEVSNLNAQIEGYLNSAEHRKLAETRPSVTFKTEIDSDLLNISCSPTHIKKTLMNLAANASEAIEGTGIVTISTTNQYLDEPLKGYGDVRIGEYAVLTVSDDGSGISPGDLERIFEPFYSKKVMGRSGTGLGLAVVWNTVQDHKGYINVRSSEKGTTVFELYFPVARQVVAAEKEETPLEDYLGHGEKILVVDDEESQREIACGMLTKLGYTAEAVSSGEDAIEYLKEKPVDLIVLDMDMPKGINGRETYEEIIKIYPGQKAIIASGFSETGEVKMAQKSGAGKYIKKPYILEKIGLAVREQLEK